MVKDDIKGESALTTTSEIGKVVITESGETELLVSELTKVDDEKSVTVAGLKVRCFYEILFT